LIHTLVKNFIPKTIEEKEYARQYKNKKIIRGVIAFRKGEIGCKIIKD